MGEDSERVFEMGLDQQAEGPIKLMGGEPITMSWLEQTYLVFTDNQFNHVIEKSIG
jgi:hypothetical protein